MDHLAQCRYEPLTALALYWCKQHYYLHSCCVMFLARFWFVTAHREWRWQNAFWAVDSWHGNC